MTTALAEATYINLATTRRNGAEVVNPVWFVVDGSSICVGTLDSTGKVKRLRRDGRVRFIVCNATGSQNSGGWFRGQARLVEDPALRKRARRLLAAKYGWRHRAFALYFRLRGMAKRRVVLEIFDWQPAPRERRG